MIEFHTAISVIVLIGFVLLLILAGLRVRSQQTIVLYLILYLSLGLLSNISQLLLAFTGEASWVSVLANFFFLAQVATFGALTLNFLERERNHLISYWTSSGLILVVWLALTVNVGGLGRTNLVPGLSNSLVLAGLIWLVSIATAVVSLASEFKQKQSAKRLNRLRYWLTATALLSVSGLFFFVNPLLFIWTGWPLVLVASILISYVILTYHTRDLSLFVGRILFHLTVGGSMAAILYLSLTATIVVSRSTTNTLIVLIWTIILALLLAILTPFVRQFLHRIFTRIIYGKQYRDEKEVIKYYSQSVSGALDIQRLAEILIRLMVETLDVKQGVVFVNKRGEPNKISLRPVSSIGFNGTSPGQFSIDSPFIDHFRKDSDSIHQYDIDVLPEFKDIRLEERQWLSDTGMEIYVPIMRHRELVGMLAFGPKRKGINYAAEEIYLMRALADQAALAMDSARLFDQLTTTNQEMGSLNEQLAGLDKNKADFLSIASHELRTPLTHIHGYARILGDFSDEELQNPLQVRNIVDGIIKGTERMKQVLDIMFDVSEVHIGEMTLFSGPVNLENVVDHAARLYLTALDDRRIAFGKNGFEDAPIIEADGTRLVQAFENLIGNAVKYTPDGGMITVSCRAIVLDEIGSAVEVIIADNGIGLDPEYHERVFEKFFRVDDPDHHSTSATKFKGAGPGLGLTLVKGIVEAHGGKVWVESQGYDEINFPGSKFFVVLPLHAVNEPKEQEEPQKQSQIETVHWRSKELKEQKEKAQKSA
ncbi:MAG TPA: GAF domain-containing sensor histidine kinase [Anaerolineae bacterium]|nr:GAF domain-containing sensor histidine kinase [Anaerolineae bacterium]